jgi:hypothetical protein
VPSEKELLKKSWKQSIGEDEYPSFADCDKLDNKTKRQQCFFEYLTELIQQKLSSDTLSILYPELDTIEVKVTIFPNAKWNLNHNFLRIL